MGPQSGAIPRYDRPVDAAAHWASLTRSHGPLGDQGFYTSNVRRDLANALEKTARKGCPCGKTCKGPVSVAAFFIHYEPVVTWFTSYVQLVSPPGRHGGGTSYAARRQLVTTYDALALHYNRLLKWMVLYGHRCPSPDHATLASITLRQVESALGDGWDPVSRISLEWASQPLEYLVAAITEPYFLDPTIARVYRDEFRRILAVRNLPGIGQPGYNKAAFEQREREIRRLRDLDAADAASSLTGRQPYEQQPPSLPALTQYPAYPAPSVQATVGATLHLNQTCLNGPPANAPASVPAALPPISTFYHAGPPSGQQKRTYAAASSVHQHTEVSQPYVVVDGGQAQPLRQVRRTNLLDTPSELASFQATPWLRVGPPELNNNSYQTRDVSATATQPSASSTQEPAVLGNPVAAVAPLAASSAPASTGFSSLSAPVSSAFSSLPAATSITAYHHHQSVSLTATTQTAFSDENTSTAVAASADQQLTSSQGSTAAEQTAKPTGGEESTDEGSSSPIEVDPHDFLELGVKEEGATN